ncbi:MAG: hypothetical protein ACR2FV_17500 [Ornithinimicrobium sp.]|uniref:hypothetical protein n=1 Tax=Ornithinimicrobium sp. TaxID=1977084 RepID=UPI003D9AFEF3
MTHAAMKGAATAPQVLGSVAILLVVGPLVPAWAGLGLGLGMVAVLVVATGLCESTAARLLRGAHKTTPEQDRLLAPVVTDLSASGNWPAGIQVRVLPAASGLDVGATGRNTLLVTGGLLRALDSGTVSCEEAAALLAHGLGRLAAGTTRSDLTIQAATLPVAVPLTAARFVLGGLRALPLGTTMTIPLTTTRSPTSGGLRLRRPNDQASAHSRPFDTSHLLGAAGAGRSSRSSSQTPLCVEYHAVIIA